MVYKYGEEITESFDPDDNEIAGSPRVTITQMRHNVAAHKTDSHCESMKELVRRAQRHGYVDVEWDKITTETGTFDRLTGRKTLRTT